MADKPRIIPLGDSALTVDFGISISPELNDSAIAFAAAITRLPFPGFIEAVPAYASVGIFYNPTAVRRAFPGFASAFAAVDRHVTDVLTRHVTKIDRNPSFIEIPVDFGADHALDLSFIAEQTGITSSEIIDIFTAMTYRVYMLGFLPGFAYMGEVDERIAIARRESPRVRVPKGSVGIAGQQAGIYPFESPGGWQIIGRTGMQMFDPTGDSPCPVRAGDLVKFVASTQ